MKKRIISNDIKKTPSVKAKCFLGGWYMMNC